MTNRRFSSYQEYRTYTVWRNMRARCLTPSHPDYVRYGGRGITVDPRWHSFESFVADMGLAPPGLTLNRKENNSGYNKGNCEWATQQVQTINCSTRADNKLGERGIHLNGGRYYAKVTRNGETKFLGDSTRLNLQKKRVTNTYER